MIEAELTFLEVQRKSRLGDAVEAGQAGLGVGPEALDAVDVAAVGGELVLAVVDPQVFGVAQIDQAVVAPPVVGVDDTIETHASANHLLQYGFGAIRHQLGVGLAVPLEDAEHGCLAARSAAASPPNPLGAEAGLVGFDLAPEGAGFFASLGHADPQRTQQTVHGVTVEAGELSDLRGGEIGGDMPDKLAKGRFGDPRTMNVTILYG